MAYGTSGDVTPTKRADPLRVQDYCLDAWQRTAFEPRRPAGTRGQVQGAQRQQGADCAAVPGGDRAWRQDAEARAVETLPARLGNNLEARTAALAVMHKVIAATGVLNAGSQRRLDRIKALFRVSPTQAPAGEMVHA